MTQTMAMIAATEQGEETVPAANQRTGGSHIPPAMTFDDLLGNDNLPDETAEEIIHAVREWRDAATP